MNCESKMTVTQIWASALVGIALVFSVTQALASGGLTYPTYCRIADVDAKALAEDVLTQESPRDAVTNNLYMVLKATAVGAPQGKGKSIEARITNVLWGGPGSKDQFQVLINVNGKPYMKTGRQDLPIYIDFYVDEARHRLVCFEDIV